MGRSQSNSPTIIPIASGKGGVGKSFLAAQLSLSIANLGYQTVAIDLDLGGSNLHSFLGIPNEHAGVGDFILNKGKDLTPYFVPTENPKLKFIPGDGLSPFLANINHAQKVKLLKTIRNLSCEYIVLDLGAGSTFNTLDFFGLSSKGIVVTIPEYSSIMNLMVFLKSFVLRTLTKEVSNKHKLKDILEKARKQTVEGNSKSIAMILDEIGQICPESAERIKNRLSDITPRFVINMVREEKDLDFLPAIKESLYNRLSLMIESIGFVKEDSSLNSSRDWRRPNDPISSNNNSSEEINQIAWQLTKAAQMSRPA